MNLLLQSRCLENEPIASNVDPMCRKWTQQIKVRPNKSKMDPTFQSHPKWPPVLKIHDTTSKQLTCTRNGLSQPACKFSAAPVHFQMPTLMIL
ncbi:hypothetical protein PAXRUDRAFT_835757, partial [Paxillus rubicundulus Ve08.2h10]